MYNVIIVGLGGFLGSSARYLVQKFVSENVASTFPIATFSINLLGSLLIGLLFGLSSKYNVLSTEMRLFLTTGFCGGFTTFSTFSNESFLLLKNGNYFYFSLYASLSVILGLFFVYLGYAAFKN